MINLRTVAIFVVVLCCGATSSAYAARQFMVSSANAFWGGFVPLDPPDCGGVQAILKGSTRPDLADGSCVGLDAALMVNDGNAVFQFVLASNGASLPMVTARAGNCVAGDPGGSVEVLAGYGNATTREITQVLQDPAPWAQNGCMVMIKADLQCYTKATDAEVAPGIKKIYCLSSTAETGDLAGANSQPAEDGTPYAGGGTPGGGTDPGTGGGGTDPGTGGGGGTNPGTGGGGGTDPGTGGGGTDPGGGGSNPGGGSGGGGDGTDFCSRHPGSSICQNSGVSGNCATFTCNGDAIQCSILREVHEANCKAAADDAAADASGIGKLGKGVLEGNDPDGDKLPRPGNASEISMPSLDSSGWLGGGECFADKHVSVLGREIVIPFSKACGALIVFRYAIMIVAALASFKMLAGAIFRE